MQHIPCRVTNARPVDPPHLVPVVPLPTVGISLEGRRRDVVSQAADVAEGLLVRNAKGGGEECKCDKSGYWGHHAVAVVARGGMGDGEMVDALMGYHKCMVHMTLGWLRSVRFGGPRGQLTCHFHSGAYADCRSSRTDQRAWTDVSSSINHYNKMVRPPEGREENEGGGTRAGRREEELTDSRVSDTTEAAHGATRRSSRSWRLVHALPICVLLARAELCPRQADWRALGRSSSHTVLRRSRRDQAVCRAEGGLPRVPAPDQGGEFVVGCLSRIARSMGVEEVEEGNAVSVEAVELTRRRARLRGPR